MSAGGAHRKGSLRTAFRGRAIHQPSAFKTSEPCPESWVISIPTQRERPSVLPPGTHFTAFKPFHSIALKKKLKEEKEKVKEKKK